MVGLIRGKTYSRSRYYCTTKVYGFEYLRALISLNIKRQLHLIESRLSLHAIQIEEKFEMKKPSCSAQDILFLLALLNRIGYRAVNDVRRITENNR